MRNIFNFSLNAPVMLLAPALLLLSSFRGVAQEHGFCKTFLAGDTAVHFASVVFNNQPADAGSDAPEIAALSWTTVSSSVPGNTTRSLLYFNVGSIPADAEVTGAKLYLFAKKDNTEGNLGNPKFGRHNGYLLQPVTNPWSPAGLSWGGQPGADGHRGKAVADDQNHFGNDTIDVTEMIKDWVVKPSKNYGMLLRLKTEKVYSNAVLHPVAVRQAGDPVGTAGRGISLHVRTASDLPAMPVLANSVIFYGGQAAAAVQPRLVVYYTLKTHMTVKLFPNPANTLLQLNFVSPADGTALAEILDMSGHVLSLRQAEAVRGNNQLSFTDLSGLSGGVYIMKLTLNGNTITKKFTIVH